MIRLAAFLAIGLICTSVTAKLQAYAEPKSGSSSTLDDELLKDLGADPLDDLKVKKPEKAKPPAKKQIPSDTKPSKPQALDSLDEELLKGLGGDANAPSGDASQSGEDNPLIELNRQMRESEQRIRAANGDAETQELQKEIVRKLEKLIDELDQKQQQKQSSSSNSQKQRQQQTADQKPQSQPDSKPSSSAKQKPTEKPTRDSSGRTVNRETQKPDMNQVHEILKDIWGELPPRLRQQMMQSSIEKFIPKYELLIEEYFKALAEQQREAGGSP